MTRQRRPMVLLISNVAAPVIGGISTYLTTLQSGLAGMGIPSRLLALSPAQISRYAHFRRRWPARAYFMLTIGWLALRGVLWALWYRLCGYRVVVHSHSANYCLVIAALLRCLGCRAIHTFHSPLRRRCPYLMRFAPRLDATVYVSEYQRESYRAIAPLAAKCEAIVPGRVDETRFHPPSLAERQAARQRLGLPEEAVVVIFTGRLVRVKGAQHIINALLPLRHGVPAWYVLLAGGPGPTPQDAAFLRELHATIERHGIVDRVLLLGAITDVDALIDLYHAADIAACLTEFPAFPEPSCLAAVEAMACGLPVIGSRNGGIPERIDDGQTGYLVDMREDSAVTQAFRRLIADPALRARMGAAAREKVLEQYTHAQMMRAYCQLYGIAPRPAAIGSEI